MRGGLSGLRDVERKVDGVRQQVGVYGLDAFDEAGGTADFFIKSIGVS